MKKDLMWALLVIGLIALGLVRGEIGAGRYGISSVSIEEDPEMFMLWMAVLTGLACLFFYRAFTRSE